MSTLDEIRPSKKMNIIDLVSEAGIDVSNWALYGDGNRPASQNPKYSFEWSFIETGKVVALCLWHNNFNEMNDTVYQHIDFNAIDNELIGIRRTRFRKFRETIKIAFVEKLPVRVVICLSEDGSMKKVDKRVLDSEPWTVTTYEENTGQCTLARGNWHIKFIDQFSLQEPTELEETRKRDVTGTAFCRSADVRRKALERAQGHCEYCGISGFKMVNNEIYLETHHIIPLLEYGPDNTSNVAALCPNHHREAHHGQNRKDIQGILMSKFSGR